MIARLRAWAESYTARGRYSPVGIAFHWTMAALVMFQIGWGWYASRLPVGGDKLHAYEVHSAVGLPVLLLAIGRLIWRMMIPGPVNDADRGGWQTMIAHVTHVIFYICFFGLPLSGWLMWSATPQPQPLRLAGVLPWPQMPLSELPETMVWTIMDRAEDVHHILIVTLLLLIPAHVGASLKHHFWDRHDVLSAMIPEVPDVRVRTRLPRRS